MKIKDQAYQLHTNGLSYKQISTQLGISKTAAFEYVKEIKLRQGNEQHICVPTHSELQKNDRSEHENSQKPIPETATKNTTRISPELKTFCGDDLIKKEFITYDFSNSKFDDLIGSPSKPFHGFIFGLPKSGKSYFSIFLADYLQEFHGRVLYVAAEEGESVTLQKKFTATNGSKMTVLPSRDREAIREFIKNGSWDMIFFDSINNAGIDSDFLEQIKNENPKVSTVAICQATKAGNFRGDQALTHNCDFIIEVANGIAIHEGRFNCNSQLEIFTEPLYQKNTIMPEMFVLKEGETNSNHQQIIKENTSTEIRGSENENKEQSNEISEKGEIPHKILHGIVKHKEKPQNPLPTEIKYLVQNENKINSGKTKKVYLSLDVLNGLANCQKTQQNSQPNNSIKIWDSFRTIEKSNGLLPNTTPSLSKNYNYQKKASTSKNKNKAIKDLCICVGTVVGVKLLCDFFNDEK